MFGQGSDHVQMLVLSNFAESLQLIDETWHCPIHDCIVLRSMCVPLNTACKMLQGWYQPRIAQGSAFNTRVAFTPDFQHILNCIQK